MTYLNDMDIEVEDQKVEIQQLHQRIYSSLGAALCFVECRSSFLYAGGTSFDAGGASSWRLYA